MTTYGFHASHEQFSPRTLLDALGTAEEAGFAHGMCSDHFAPWSTRQGHAGHAWTWLGAALERTRFPLGVVTSPGYRYHPAVLAQAAATLSDMYPGRFWLALGSGQALNEQVTAEPWPPKEARTRRTATCASLMRALLAGETVSYDDGEVRMREARLWSLPEQPPPLLAAAVTPATAARAAAWADGLITINQPGDAQQDTLAAYRDAGGWGPTVLQAHLSWHPDRTTARTAAHDQWREAVLGSDVGWEIRTPEHFEQAARFTSPDDVEPYVHVASDLRQHAHWLAGRAVSGFDRVMLHQVGADQHAFIEAFAAHVLPEVTS